jgi:hypothetical protein
MKLTRMAIVCAGIGVSAYLSLGSSAAQVTKQPPPQQAAQPPSQVDFIAEPLETCGFAIDEFDNAEQLLADNGWVLEDPGETGPYLAEIWASKEYDVATGYYYAALETYPGAVVGFCEYEVDMPPATIDLNVFVNEYGFEGPVQNIGDGQYAAWRVDVTGQTYYILASRTRDLYHFQVTWISPTTP